MTPDALRATCMLVGVACLCLILTMKATAPEKVLFDFSNPNTPAWQIVNDNVMGGVSTSRFSVTNGVAVFRGEVSLENNGGFASVRSPAARHDLAGFDAFVVRARGDGRTYKFTVRTESGFDAPIYQCAFTTKSGVWEEHRLAFKDFVPTFRGRVLSGQTGLGVKLEAGVEAVADARGDTPKRMRRLIRQWLLSPVEWKRHAQQRNARVHALASWVALRRGLLSKLLPRCRELRGVGGVKTG